MQLKAQIQIISSQIQQISTLNLKELFFRNFKRKMAFRKIQHKINTFQPEINNLHVQNHNIQYQTEYDQQEPSHPKTIVQSKSKWTNSKLKNNTARTTINNYHGLKVSTARQTSRDNVKKYQAGRFTALNTSRNSIVSVKVPQNNQSPSKPDVLFVPQPNKKAINKARFPLQSNKIKQKYRNSSFSASHYNSSFIEGSKQKNSQNQQLQLNGVSEIKLMNKSKTIHQASNLRRFENQQKQRQKLLHNRLKFITIDNQRQAHKLNLAKRKYQKVLSVRSDFLKQKQALNKMKLSNYLQQMSQKNSRVRLVKDQQNQRKLSVSRTTQIKNLQASQIRQQLKDKQIEKYSKINYQLQKNKQIVKRTQSSLQNSRERQSQMHRSRISEIRTLQNKKLIKNYLVVGKRQKENQKLYQTLQKQIQLINQRKLKATSELKEYENCLGLNLKKTREVKPIAKKNREKSQQSSFGRKNTNFQRIGSSTINTSVSKSFYLTNY